MCRICECVFVCVNCKMYAREEKPRAKTMQFFPKYGTHIGEHNKAQVGKNAIHKLQARCYCFRSSLSPHFQWQNRETDINRRQFKFKCMLSFKYHESLHEYTIMCWIFANSIWPFIFCCYLQLKMNEWMNERVKLELLYLGVCVPLAISREDYVCVSVRVFSTFASLNQLNIYSYENETNWK